MSGTNTAIKTVKNNIPYCLPLILTCLVFFGGPGGEFIQRAYASPGSDEATQELLLNDFLAEPMPLPEPKKPEVTTPEEATNKFISFDLFTKQESTFSTDSLSRVRVKGNPGIQPIPTKLNEEDKLKPLRLYSESWVDNTTDYPHSTSVKVFSEFDGSWYACSGSLIDSKHVLTAGHCIYDPEVTSPADRVIAVPAYNNGDTPFGFSGSENLFVPAGWKDYKDYDYDLGIIQLERPVGALSGWLGYESVGVKDGSCSSLKNSIHDLEDFPYGNYDGQRMWWRRGRADSCVNTDDNNQVDYDSVAHSGESGGVLYREFYSCPDCYAQAVVSRGNSSTTRVVLLSNASSIVSVIDSNTPSGANLIPLNARISKNELRCGEGFKVNFTVHNYSSASFSSSVPVNVYLSPDDEISSSDRQVCSGTLGSTWGPKDTNIGGIDCTLPDNVSEGDYYLGVILDSDYTSSEDNNTDGWDADSIHVNSCLTDVDVSGPNTVQGKKGEVANYQCTAFFANAPDQIVTDQAEWSENLDKATIASNGILEVTSNVTLKETGEISCSYTENDTTESDSMAVTLTDEEENSETCFSVSAGWNLVSLPVEPNDPTPSAVFDEVPGTLYLWEYTEGGNWNTVQEGTLTSVDSLGSYYLWLPGDSAVSEICTSGTAFSGDKNISMDDAGWYSFGVPYSVQWGGDGTFTVGDGTDVNDLPTAVNVGWLYPKIWEFDTSTGSFRTFTVTDGNILDPDKGYWIYTLKSGLTMNFSRTDGPYSPPTPSSLISTSNFKPQKDFPPVPKLSIGEFTFDTLEVDVTTESKSIHFSVAEEQEALVKDLKVEIFDTSGHRLEVVKAANDYSASYSTSNIPNGIYLYIASVNTWEGSILTSVGKFLVMK